MYKKVSLVLVILGICFWANLKADAATYTFTPNINPNSFTDGNYYLWDINWAPPAGQTILSATLYIDNIDDYATSRTDTSNLLSIYLLNYVGNPKSTYGLSEIAHTSNTTTWDGKETSKIEKALEGVSIGTYSDSTPVFPGGKLSPADLTFSLTGTLLNDLIADDLKDFAIGFDPDCHFEQGSIKLVIVTDPPAPATPEPATLSLLGLGFGLLGFKKRFS